LKHNGYLRLSASPVFRHADADAMGNAAPNTAIGRQTASRGALMARTSGDRGWPITNAEAQQAHAAAEPGRVTPRRTRGQPSNAALKAPLRSLTS